MNTAEHQLSGGNRPRICLILPHLGPWPSYFDLFLHSCRSNPDVDWLLFCDHPPPEIGDISNVRIRFTTKGELAQRIADTLQTPVNLSVPYKLCDFKPAYGVIFGDELRDYHFWGHCDSDIVFGQIRRFVTDEILDSYDKILMHAYMSFYRNSPAANGFFRLNMPSMRFQDVFADPRYRRFDEWGGMARILRHHNIPFFHRELMATPATRHYELQALNVKNYYPQAFIWDEGRILQLHWNGSRIVETEFALIHLMRRKMRSADFSVDSSLRRFAILPHGFQQLSAMPSTPGELLKLNPRRRWYPAYFTMMRPFRRMRKLLRERSLLKHFPPHNATKPMKVAT